MSKSYSAGIVTAYGAAVRGGYTGTYEDFCRQQAQYGANADAVEQAKRDAQNAASNASTSATNASQASLDAISAKTQAETAAQSAQTIVDGAVSGINEATAASISAVQSEGNTQIGAVQSAGAQQTANARAQADAAVAAASAASSYAGDAGDAATNAANSATAAAGSATTAAGSATAAGQSADQAAASAASVSSASQQISQNATDIGLLKADLTDITGNEIINSWTMQRYIKTDVDPINISSPVVNSGYAYVVIPCTDGDEFTLTGTGAVAAGLWTFIDSSGYKLSQSAANAVATNLVLTAPSNSAYLVINVKPVNDYFVCKGDFLQKRISDIEEKLLYDTEAILNPVSGYVRSDTGGVVSSTVYKYATLYTIPNQKIIYNGGFNGNALTSLCFYTANGKYIPNSSVLAKNYDQEITTPENAYIIKATIADASHTGYIKYSTDESVVSKLGELSAIDANNSVIPKVVLPKESIAVIGHEWNMYYENVILGLTDAYYVVCRCTGNGLGRTAYKDCLRFTPSSGEQGAYTVYIEVYSKRTQALIDSGSFTLRVIADTAVTGKKAIFIGDSLTDDGVYPAEIQYNLSHGGIVSVGTINEDITYVGQTYNVNHEGRGGWTTTNYMTAQSVSGVANPFYNPSSQTFDFSYYMNQNGFSGVDLVSIYLGTNADTSFDVTIENLNAMIESIHDYDANIKILINTFHEAAGQDGCGNHNGLLSSQVLRNTRLNNTRLLLYEYESNNHVNVYPTTLYFNVDGEHDYSTVQQPLSSRNPETVVRQNNNVHPSVYGYLKFADSIYNQMLYLLA